MRTDPAVKLVLYTRPGCHLCEVAKEEVRARFPDLLIEEVNVDEDPALAARWGEEVPVGFVGGEKAFKYHADERRLRRLLRRAGWES